MAKQGSFKLAEGEKIKAVMVRHRFIVDGIGFEIVDKSGKETTKWFSEFNSGALFDLISLGAYEYITQISGTYGKYLGKEIHVATMKIHTNLNPKGYGPYGRGEETQDIKYFSTPTYLGGKIVGFLASYGPYLGNLASFGVFATHPVTNRHGPYGRAESPNWSLEVKGQQQPFCKIVVNHGHIVDGIGFQNPISGELLMYSGPGGSRSEVLLGTNEYVTKISGEYGEYLGEVNVTSIKIHTNLCPNGYGPYGKSRDVANVTPFSTPLPLAGAIIGFFGNYGTFLKNIGIINTYDEIKEYGTTRLRSMGRMDDIVRAVELWLYQLIKIYFVLIT